MKAAQVQLQKRQAVNVDQKLDKIANLLEILVQMQETSYYPPENKMKRAFISKCKSILKEIRSGRMKTNTYKSMAEFTRTIS